MNNLQRRKSYTAAEKAAIIRRHMVDKVPLSTMCEEHGLQAQRSVWLATT